VRERDRDRDRERDMELFGRQLRGNAYIGNNSWPGMKTFFPIETVWWVQCPKTAWRSMSEPS